MNQEIGSIMGYFYKKNPIKIYQLQAPKDFIKPSFYFPPPGVVDSNDTNTTFLKTYILSVKVFHEDSIQAYELADSLADSIRQERHSIPVLHEDGTETNTYVRFSRIETRLAEAGVSVITLTWDSRYDYAREEINYIQNITMKSEVR